MEVVALETIHKLKMNLKKRAGSISKLSKTFNLMDINHSGSLEQDEFEACLQKAGLFISKHESQALMRHFDINGDRKLSCQEFLSVLREELNPRRKAFVERCFHLMDRNNSGSINSLDLKSTFCAVEHPDVISGKKTEDQVLREFLDQFESTSCNNDGDITHQEWTA